MRACTVEQRHIGRSAALSKGAKAKIDARWRALQRDRADDALRRSRENRAHMEKGKLGNAGQAQEKSRVVHTVKIRMVLNNEPPTWRAPEKGGQAKICEIF